MKVHYFQEAMAEMLESIDYYTAIHQSVGEYFYNDIEYAISVIKKFPKSGKKHDKYVHLRIRNCKRFPYSLIYHYEEEKSRIYIVAVAHHRRSPDYWEKRF